MKKEVFCELCYGKIEKNKERKMDDMVVCQDCYDSEYEQQIIEG